MMNIIEVQELTSGQKEEIYSLWNEEYPEKLAYRSPEGFDEYLDGVLQKFHLLLLDAQQQIAGWFFLFERTGEDWFAMILAARVQGKGYGTRLLEQAKAITSSLSGWVTDHNNDHKLNGDVYRSPVLFYVKNGFQLLPEERFESAKLSAVKMVWTSS